MGKTPVEYAKAMYEGKIYVDHQNKFAVNIDKISEFQDHLRVHYLHVHSGTINAEDLGNFLFRYRPLEDEDKDHINAHFWAADLRISEQRKILNERASGIKKFLKKQGWELEKPY